MPAVLASNSGKSPSNNLGVRVLYDGSTVPSGHPLVEYVLLPAHLLGNLTRRMISIVAVHGIGANPDTTWVKSDVNWLKDKHMLPEVIPNARVLRLGYESQWFGTEAIQQRLPLVAEQLLRGLVQLRTVCNPARKDMVTVLLNSSTDMRLEHRSACRDLSYSLGTVSVAS